MSYLTEWKDLIYERDPAAWIDRYIQKNELNQPFALYPHQREILKLMFDFDAEGVLGSDTLVWSCVKKSGKTSLLAILSLWWAMTQEAPNEIILVANDMEQTLSRAYGSLVRLLKYNTIDPGAIITAKEVKLSNETTIRAIAAEYSGAAGANHGLVGFDELWAYTSERSQRLYEELTSVPTRRNSIKLVVTYAGFETESHLLKTLYLQGVSQDEHPDGQGQQMHPTLPIYGNAEARLCVYWDHEPRLPWQTPKYYASQKRSLRASQYLRFHENRWTNTSEAFITPEMWDSCVNPDHRPLLPETRTPLVIGIDAGVKRDSSAVVAVGLCEVEGHGERVGLALHRIWTPTAGDEVDLESTIEQYILDLCRHYRVYRIVADPWQMLGTIQRLRKQHIPIEEFPQSVGNLTRAGQTLYDLLNGRNLLLYPSAELRQQAMLTVSVESSRGWRISKERAAHRIDAVVALAMACVSLLEYHSLHRFAPIGQ